LTAPSGVSVIGIDAEWIVERPTLIGQVEATLPRYTPVNFTKAAAWSRAASGPITSFKSFALQSGFSVPVNARAVAASLDFIPPVSFREMMSERAALFAGLGETDLMDDGGVLVSIGIIQGIDSVQCQYVGP
jgi:hypothetical protein